MSTIFFRIAAVCLILVGCAFPAWAADDEEDEDYPPGLLARYRVGDRQLERVDPDIQFAWGAGSPDSRLPAGAFEAAWSGKLLVRREGEYRLHVYVQGTASVSIQGKEIVTGKSDVPGWIDSQPVSLEFGELPIEVTFRKTQAEAVLKLYWSSESIPLEPIAPQLFFRDAPTPHLNQRDRGRELYFALRCNRCHVRKEELLSDVAPALTDIAVQTEWLVEWLMRPAASPLHTRMPSFGFTEAEAQAIAACLQSHAQAANRPAAEPAAAENAAGKLSSDEHQHGRTLLRSVGCLACHTHGGIGGQSLSDGGDLTQVGKKRTLGWIDSWLESPDLARNPDRRMPAVQLSVAERKSIASFLAAGASANLDQPAKAPDQVRIAAGTRLIAAARCAACHKLPNALAEAVPVAVKPIVAADGKSGCFQKTPDLAQRRPAYNLDDEEREALVAYLQSPPVRTDSGSAFEHGQRLLRQKNCLACHERDGARGITAVAGRAASEDEQLHGQSEGLIPPDLTAVGDKLQDRALDLSMAGRQPDRRLPWLRVRMPVFAHSDAEQQALRAYLIGHDRVPDRPQGSDATAAAKLAEAGGKLLGPQGFSCVACHRVGKFEPRNVALGTRGSDLFQIGARMRPEFFQRWTRSPLRIMPGIEMPSYEKAVAGVLDGKLDHQLDALWAALNQKTAPAIDVSIIEQVWTVPLGTPARIIRDVFRLAPTPDSKPEYLHRAFAAGLSNGANVLFDLETMSLRQWWLGDFAQQRTAGKSWFWEPRGIGLLGAPRPLPDLVLLPKSWAGAAIIPVRDGTTFGRLASYKTHEQGAQLAYSLSFPVGDQLTDVKVDETFHPLFSLKIPSIQWARNIRATGIPEGYQLLLLSRTGADGAATLPRAETGTDWMAIKLPTDGDSSSVQAIPLRGEGNAIAFGSFTYSTLRPATPPSTLPASAPPASPHVVSLPIEAVSSVPGYDGARLPLPRTIMPTALTWTTQGTLAFCSLRGEVFLARDTNGDGLEDTLSVFDEGLAAPYGLIADGPDLIVAHKPELLRLRDTDGDGRADVREVIASGWGYNDNYHDWTFGIVRDSKGNLYVGLGSDYAQPGRIRESTRWRGKVLRIGPAGKITPVGHAFRYPTGLAITPDDQIFVTDNQGVGNTFNEINHLVEGGQYGVPSLFEEPHAGPALNPAIQVPHPWTRSVNGVFFLNAAGKDAAARFGSFAGQGIGCEYDSRFLMRFSLQRIGDTYQGAAYPFSIPPTTESADGFLGTLCGGVSPGGDIYIGSIHDSGWLGGLNVGDIVRLRPNQKLPLGIRELRAEPQGFVVTFTDRVDPTSAGKPEHYSISGYTRVWAGAYATPDSGRHKVEITSAEVIDEGRAVRLTVDRLQENYVYDVTCSRIGVDPQTPLWPATGHYTMNRIPTSADARRP